MSQIKKLIIPVLFLMTGLLAAGCGDPNAKAVFSADTGKHPAGWLPSGHAAAAAGDGETCTECHGSDLSGGISGVSCMSCHTSGSPLILTGCTSCHGKPPSGTVAPNRAGAHNTVTGHFAAQVKLPDGCNTCHKGAGSGTLNHDNGKVDVAFLSAYNAKSGTAVPNADGTCSNVSCHGGQTTPNWFTGSIDVAAQCTLCHSFGTSEYNSFVSGEHAFHVNTLLFSCTACHDAAKLAVNHFSALNTPQLEGPAAATIKNSINYDGATCKTPGCHGADTWQQ